MRARWLARSLGSRRVPTRSWWTGSPSQRWAWRSYSIACASIVAKVVRDRLMTRLARRYPAYGWETNAGYGTPAHLAGLRAAGLTAHHRVSFCRTALGGQLEL
jgi:ribonuclease HII